MAARALRRAGDRRDGGQKTFTDAPSTEEGSSVVSLILQWGVPNEGSINVPLGQLSKLFTSRGRGPTQSHHSPGREDRGCWTLDKIKEYTGMYVSVVRKNASFEPGCTL